ncbi:MAG TPA: helix-turn-helix domain-containing protein [Nocardioides sp.]
MPDPTPATPATPASPEPVARRPRADATRNRARVSDAAVAVFAERGLDATVADVAHRAGVGNATVFRHFPTKSDLLSEVASRWLEEWTAEVSSHLERHGDDTLRLLLVEVLERFRRDRFALDLLRNEDLDDRMKQAHDDLERRFTVALVRAVEAGLVAPDITYADLSVLVLGMATRLAEIDAPDPDAWSRAARFAWAAIAR